MINEFFKSNRFIEQMRRNKSMMDGIVDSINFSRQIVESLKFTKTMQLNFQNTIRVREQMIGNINFQESFNKIREGLIETEKDVKEFKTLMVEIGFPPSNEMDIRTIRRIAQEYRKDKISVNKNVIEEFMCIYYNEKTIQNMSKEWERNELLQERIQVLRTAIRSHNLKMYEVSVPTVISQLEGLLIDAFKIDGYVRNNVLNILLEELVGKESKSEISFDRDIYDIYKLHILSGFLHGKETHSEISRNAILHGGHKSYGTEVNSLKVILLFDYLANAASEITPEQIEDVQNKVEQVRNPKKVKPIKQEITGWLGGQYDYFGFYDTKEDAERGYLPTERMYEVIDPKFDGKKVKITIEIVE